jgi:acyl-CoA thioesterase-1
MKENTGSGGEQETCSRSPSRGKVVFLGDSLTAGYGLNMREAFPALIQSKIDQELWPLDVVNAGISGDTSAGARRRLPLVLTPDVRMLVIAIGANDGLRRLELAATEKNIDEMITLATQRSVPVVLAAMQIPPFYGVQYAAQFREMYLKLAKKHRVILMPFLLEGVALKAELTLADRMHPNARGQRIMAENVWATLMPVLRHLVPSTQW